MASLLSGMQSSSAGTQHLSTSSRNPRMARLFSSGCDISRKISLSPSTHSAMVCP